MRLIKLSLIAAVLTLAACENGAEKTYLGAQRTFNTATHDFNQYAAQPFCGADGAPPPPACADAAVVDKAATAATAAQEGLDEAKDAITNPNLDRDSVASIVASAVGAVGKFAGIIAKHWKGVMP